MTLIQIEYFLAAAHHGSFSAAADESDYPTRVV